MKQMPQRLFHSLPLFELLSSLWLVPGSTALPPLADTGSLGIGGDSSPTVVSAVRVTRLRHWLPDI